MAMGAIGGAAAYGGYQQGRKTEQEIDLGDIKVSQAKLDQEGTAALGNAIPILHQMMVPGATAMPQGAGAPAPSQMAQGSTPAPQAPQPPMGMPSNLSQGESIPQPPPPGQPSVPMQQPGAQPQMLGGPAPPNDPTMSVRPQPPMQPPRGAPPAPSGGMPQPGQPPQGRLDLHSVMGAVIKANPGASPQVIAAAVAKALPLMTAQSQMDYKQLMTQLAGGRLDNARNNTNSLIDRREAQTDQGDYKLGQGDQRIQQGATNEAGRNERFNTGETRKTDQGNRRLDQGDRRLDQGDTREARLAVQSAVKQDQGWQRLDQQKQALEARVQQGGDRAALSEWRAVVDAQHKRAMEIIQTNSLMNTMPEDQKKALIKEQNDFYKGEIERMRKGPARPERPAGADTTAAPPKDASRPPPSGPPGQQGAPSPVRPRAQNPKTGELVEFDGKAWVPVAQ